MKKWHTKERRRTGTIIFSDAFVKIVLDSEVSLLILGSSSMSSSKRREKGTTMNHNSPTRETPKHYTLALMNEGHEMNYEEQRFTIWEDAAVEAQSLANRVQEACRRASVSVHVIADDGTVLHIFVADTEPIFAVHILER